MPAAALILSCRLLSSCSGPTPPSPSPPPSATAAPPCRHRARKPAAQTEQQRSECLHDGGCTMAVLGCNASRHSKQCRQRTLTQHADAVVHSSSMPDGAASPRLPQVGLQPLGHRAGAALHNLTCSTDHAAVRQQSRQAPEPQPSCSAHTGPNEEPPHRQTKQ